MKRIECLLLLVLAGAGCSGFGSMSVDGKATSARSAPPPPAAVTADTVNDKNAAERARALREELEYESGRKANAE